MEQDDDFLRAGGQPMSKALRLGIIADDFTGAMDTGVMAAAAAIPTQFRRRMPDPATPALVMSTDSREANARFAAAQVEKVAAFMTQRRLFKKIDSTMRGNIGSEIDALMNASGIARAVICPAAIDVGRRVQDGLLFVHGEPLHETAFAQDPYWPATTAHMTALVRHDSVAHIDLNTIRKGVHALTETLRQVQVKLVTVDAISHNDLAVIAQAATAADCLPCGSKGLAAAWIQVLGGQATEPQSPQFQTIVQQRGTLLIVVGSRHPATDRQLSLLAQQHDTETFVVQPKLDLQPVQQQMIAALGQHPVVILRSAVENLDNAQAIYAINQGLGALTQAACDSAALAGLMLIGGETTAHVCGHLDIEGIQILGEIAPGVPVGQIIGGPTNALPVITKAGGFGTDGVLTAVVDWFQGAKHDCNEDP